MKNWKTKGFLTSRDVKNVKGLGDIKVFNLYQRCNNFILHKVDYDEEITYF